MKSTGGAKLARSQETRPQLRVPGLVSIVIPSFNKQHFVTATLDSLAAQTYQEMEIVIVDDASKDNSIQVIRKWMESSPLPVRLIEKGDNQGVCKTLNHGLSLTRGEFICTLAADDRYLPHKVARHVELLQRNTSCPFVYGDASIVSEDGNLIADSMLKQSAKAFRSGQIFSHLLTQGNFIPAVSVTIRGTALDKAGGYDESLRFEDYDMWLRLSRLGPVICSETVDAIYLDSPESLSKSLGEALEVDLLRIWAKYRDDVDVNQRQLARVARAYAIRLGVSRSEGRSLATRIREIVNAAEIFDGSLFPALTFGDYVRVRARQTARKWMDAIDNSGVKGT